MANIFQEISGFLKDGASDIAKGVAWIGNIGKKVEAIFQEGAKLEPQTAADVVLVIGDVENLATLSAGAVGAEGINFAADSAAYAAFQKLLTDLKTLGTNLKGDVASLEQAAK